MTPDQATEMIGLLQKLSNQIDFLGAIFVLVSAAIVSILIKGLEKKNGNM